MKELQKREAKKRMKLLNMSPNVIKEFFDEDKLNKSEFGGILYWLDEKEQELVNKFNKDYEAVVYHVVKTPTAFGELLTFMYVSKYKSEWDSDMEDLKNGQALCYVHNLDEPLFSELGVIGVVGNMGGVKRTW